MRPKVKRGGGGGAYFGNPNTKLEFISTGCELLNCVVGGGWPLGRISNIVGDKSTGKTLLAIEACANFAQRYPRGSIWYNEVEAAFDKEYAGALGLPLERVEFADTGNTVEGLFAHLDKILKEQPDVKPGLYILDSLDALSDAAEMDRAIGEGSYGAEKAKKMSQLFRRLVRGIEEKRIHLMIISQVRDAIGVSFGRKTTRAGGRALDFYASTVIYLAQIERLKKTVAKVQRAIGVMVRAKCDKNKISMPFRECDFQIMFGYGVDDIAASFAWLEEVGRLGSLDLEKKDVPKLLDQIDDMSHAAFEELHESVNDAVRTAWYEIERGFLPKRRKYG